MRYDTESVLEAAQEPDRHAAARLLGCHPNGVLDLLRRRGIDRPEHWPRPGANRKGATKRTMAQMRAAAAKASSYTELAELLGIRSRQGARDLAVRHGLALKKDPQQAGR